MVTASRRLLSCSALLLACLSACECTVRGPDGSCLVDEDCPEAFHCGGAGACLVNAEEGEGEEGEGEGEIIEPGGPCTLDGVANGSGDCLDEDVCVPINNSTTVGICRTRCGELVIDGGVIIGVSRANVACPGATTCQAVTSLADAAVVAVACVAPGAARDQICSSVLDETFADVLPDAACPVGMDCQLTATGADANGVQTFTSFNCKEPCDPSDATPCTLDGEQCVKRPFDFPLDLELGPEGELRCDGADGPNPACADGDDFACECSLAERYACRALELADGSTGSFCVRDGFNCGVSVPPLFAADVPSFDSPAFSCNGVDDSRYCDQTVFAGADDPGVSVCLNIAPTANDGVCFAFCGSPSIDFNQDGDVDDVDEAGDALDCGTGFTCSPALALALGVLQPLDRACNVDACTAGEPCPTQCGAGDAYCTDIGCVAPFFACEPL